MRETLLETLRCPYCGTSFSVVENPALARRGPYIEHGILGCECCAFPVVAGIPVLIADDATRAAMHTLENGRADDALVMLLGLDGDRSHRFRALQRSRTPPTYLDTLAELSTDAEADYLAYRLSDPTFLTTEAVLRAVGQIPWTVERPVLDVCGGAGHVARVLATLRPSTESKHEAGVVVVDVSFWKLWLASVYICPGCAPVCCDANHPLPFLRDTFSTVLLSDAFPYIWHKRLLADELIRLAGPSGLVVMPHLHSALGENFSAGDTLTPRAYRDLLAPQHVRLFRDVDLFENVVERRQVDLTSDVSPDELGTEPSLTLIASRREEVFRRYDVPERLDILGELRVNPLYRVEQKGASSILTLTFPTGEYAEEFSECRRYLPDSVTVNTDLTGDISPSDVGPDYAELRRRRVLIDAPERY